MAFAARTRVVEPSIYERVGRRKTTYRAIVQHTVDGEIKVWRSAAMPTIERARFALKRHIECAPPPPPRPVRTVPDVPPPEPTDLGDGWLTEAATTIAGRVVREMLTHDDLRPSSRAECISAPRPCPWMSCRYHLGLDVSRSGGIRYHDPERLDEMKDTCALDVADRGDMTLEDVGDRLGFTRERARQVEEMGLVQLRLGRALTEFRGHVLEMGLMREGDD